MLHTCHIGNSLILHVYLRNGSNLSFGEAVVAIRVKSSHSIPEISIGEVGLINSYLCRERACESSGKEQTKYIFFHISFILLIIKLNN